MSSLSLFTFMPWRRQWQPTPVFLPGESQGRGSLVGCRLWGRTESDMTEVTSSSSSNLDKRGSNDVVGTEACIERKWNMRDIWGVFPKRDERNAELWYFLIYELCKLLYKHKIPHHIFEDLETNFICNHSINKVNVLLFYIYFTVLIHFL